MRGADGVVLIVVGLLLLYIGSTGRFGCFEGFFNCLLSPTGMTAGSSTDARAGLSVGSLAGGILGGFRLPGFGGSTSGADWGFGGGGILPGPFDTPPFVPY